MGKPDLEVADLFSGYSSLPTPFSCWIKIQDVVYDLAMLNPGKKITICPSAIHFVSLAELRPLRSGFQLAGMGKALLL